MLSLVKVVVSLLKKKASELTLKNIHPLTNIEIDKFLDYIPSYKGSFSRNNLPTKFEPNTCYIVNYDKAFQPGTHWIALWRGNNQYCEIFDPLGTPPGPTIMRFCQSTNLKIQYNSSQIQPTNSVACGYFALMYLILRNNGTSQYDILYTFEQTGSYANVNTLIKLFNNHVYNID
jgi:hypothetical protein